ncbi:MAG: GGDEF domain-containing protein [Lachnospiraceae bacterium]|nr:GGDEF domain-containing protein [Lachnospiraceae bacterium]
MSQGINMTAVYIADYVGVMMLLLILLARGWELPGRKMESRILLFLVIGALINCAVDPVIFLADGQPGKLNWGVVFFGNSFLFLYNLLVGAGTVLLIARHINSKVSKFQKITVGFMTIAETVLLAVNYFKPIVFSIDENNVYSRGPLYAVYIGAAFILLIYTFVMYLQARIKYGPLRYFPVWEFIIPILAGVTIQTLFYGVSTQPVSFAIAFGSIVINLQKEYLFVDKLTGVYNRYELDKIIKYYTKRGGSCFAAIMLDLNGFKSINDNYSHKEGDEALRTAADILERLVANDGNVIRFAGDEFIVMINSCDEEMMKQYCEKIRAAFEEYNETSDKPYRLAAAIGGATFTAEDKQDFLDHIDRLMYEDKKEFYRNHDRRQR